MAAAGRQQHAEAGAGFPRPRRIAALIATTDISGPGRQLVALGTELKSLGVEVVIALMSRPGTSTAFADFARAHGLTCEVIADTGPLDLGAAQRVRAWLDSVRPDIVQTHSYKQTGIVYLLRKSGVRLPWVAFFEGETDKGLRDRVYNKLELAMLGAADQVVVMSELQRQKFKRLGGRVRVVYNSVPRMPPAGSHKAVLPAALSAPRGSSERPIIGAIGRLSREKGCDVFLECIAQLKRRGVPTTGVLVGDGAEEVNLRKLAGDLGLEHGRDVVFAGRIEDMVSVYSALDLMVIPSRSEGLPSVLLEAMQQDVPVVSTRVGAMIEIAAQTPEALELVPVENPDALADAIERALEQRGDEVGRNARATLVEAFSGAVRARRMLEVYSDALAARGSKGGA